MSNLKDVFESKNTHREPAADLDAEAFAEVVRSRRSIRKYTDAPVDETVMRECLELALLAPNSSNLQPWEFYWVRNPEKRKEIDQAFLSQPAATTAAEIVVAVARTSTWKKHSKEMIVLLEKNEAHSAAVYYKKIVPFVYSLGFFNVLGFLKKVVFFLIGLSRPTPREMTSQCELRIWAVKSTALACENLMLSLRAYGYDSCPMEGMDSRRVKKILSLPKDAEVVMGISAGKRAEDGVYGQQIRFSSAQFIKEI